MEIEMNATYPISIYYDSSCPLCNQEMTRLKQLDQAGNLNLIDCSSASFAAPEGSPGKENMMQLLHVLTADGVWVIGVPAFRLAYAGVGFHFVADWLDKPYVSRVMHRIYPLIARNRYLIPGWFAEVWFNWLASQALRRSQSCSNGQCKI
jgi:predicted DCC family thiol-disulfide oxidoreductase YuxK